MPERTLLTRLRGYLSIAPLRYGLMLTAASVSMVWAWSLERGSVERANRLHREGRRDEALAIYGARAEDSEPNDFETDLRYNLGTALIDQGNVVGEEELGQALESPNEDVRGRARYNVGLSRLNRALDAVGTDSARMHAKVSVAANRSALRLRPDDLDTKWNLAIGLRLLDSIQTAARRSGREMADGDASADVVTRSINIPDAAEDEFAEDPPAEGENEAVAEASDDAPLSLEDAESILGITHLDSTQILTKLLALESRGHRGRQRRRTPRRW